MASAEWEEVRRLAKDFQRAQLSSASQKLSERNCIEIVNKLIEAKSIEVIYTLDGKEYLTPAQVTKEIRDELIIHGGRINLVDLQQILNIDFTFIEAKANEVVKHDRNVFLVLGQLIDNDYLDHLAEEINDQLQDTGQLTIADLTKANDVPAEFLTEAVEQRLGTIIEGQMDPMDRGVIFTQAFVDRHRSRIRGALSAITKPTSISNILNQYHIPDKLFHTIVDDLQKENRLKGSLSGRQDKALYIPDIFSRTQNEWVDSFYRQNGYLEYDTLSRLGIADPKSYAKRRFKSENLLFLQSCCVGKVLRDRVEASVEEALSTGTWIDVLPLLPTSFSSSDSGQILHQCLKGSSQLEGKVFCDTIVCSQQFLADCRAMFDPMMRDKAQEDAKRAPEMLLAADRKALSSGSDAKKDRKEERRKKAAGTGGSGSARGGGGGQAREIKTKKVKKNRGKEAEDEEEDDTSRGSRVSVTEFPFLTIEKIEEVLSERLGDCPEELQAELAQELFRPLTRAYQDVVKEAFLTLTGGSAASRRKTRDDTQEKINLIWSNIRQFMKGVKQCSDDEDLEGQLSRYLLRSLCSDVTNLLCTAVAEPVMGADTTNFTPEERASIISKLPDKIKSAMTKLNSSLSGKDLDEFATQLEHCCDPSICDVMLKKADKKKDRQAVFHHRQALCEQLRNESDPAMALHLTVTVAFQNSSQCMLHAPGRCVPQLISHLEQHLGPDQHALLVQYQELVQHLMAASREQDRQRGSREGEGESNAPSSDGDHGDVASLKKQLEELLNKVKDIALVKKGSAAAAAASED
ncbi:E3 UFM1-protein ligase 1-like [Diadema antillarum]|uniref:E3 UFM1-protein ligase 1-like n=1 Tax=Diadema antillarum TaxID=105358 RepID=UPI003A886C5E